MFGKKKMLGMTLAVCSGLVLGVSPQARADQRDFAFSSDWFQPSKGEREIESHTSYDGKSDTFKQKLEFEMGLSKRISIAPIVEFQHKPGGSLEYEKFEFETRYQLGKFERGKILPGLYLEYGHDRDGEDELEGKLILSRYGKNGDDLTFNLVVERALENGAEWEHSYSLGYARDLGKKGNRIGAEWVHDLSSGRINAGPTLGLHLGDIWLVSSYAFPVNSRDNNKAQIRMVAEYEF